MSTMQQRRHQALAILTILLFHFSPIGTQLVTWLTKDKMLGSTRANRADHAYQVQIWVRTKVGPFWTSKFRCSGTLLKVDTVLTAAHCIE